MMMLALDRGATMAKTRFPIKKRRRPVIATTALPFEAIPAASTLENYARRSLASRKLRASHSLV
ncbi:MAG: hypothetical protein J0G95_03320 [Rhizobiales bacterium]|nr:hypothetical protein [Hyphomicrobiales bacterium]